MNTSRVLLTFFMIMGRECSRLEPSYQCYITFVCYGSYQLHPYHRLCIMTLDLRPISVTPILSRLCERYVVNDMLIFCMQFVVLTVMINLLSGQLAAQQPYLFISYIMLHYYWRQMIMCTFQLAIHLILLIILYLLRNCRSYIICIL